MKNINQKSIDTLNNLLIINSDRIESYELTTRETEEQDLKELFSQLIITSNKCKQELTEEIERLGGIPKEGTRITGIFFRAWMEVKAALSRKDRGEILKSCEFGEEVAVKNYAYALKHYFQNGLSHHQLLSKQYSLIKADYDNIKNLRQTATNTMNETLKMRDLYP